MNSIPQVIESTFNEDTNHEKRNTNTNTKVSTHSSIQPALESQVSDAGRVAWLTVGGAWLTLFSTFGYLYSFGVYQDYYTRVFLSNDSTSRIAWIGSIQLTMPFVIGLWSGKLFDDGHFHVLQALGGIIFTFSLFMLSLTKPGKYYQVFLSQGIGMGLGLGFTFVPTFGVLNHHFRRRKALATGISLTGTSMGAVVFPIMLNHLIPSIGFAKAVRASGYVVLGCLVLGNCLMRTAYAKVKPLGGKPPLSIKSFFVDMPYMWGVFGALFSSIGVYFPLVYLQLYSIQHNIDPVLAFYSIAIINGASCFGRLCSNYLADLYGPFNIFLAVMVGTAATIFSVLGVRTSATLVVVSILYGFFSGAWLSVSMAALASLSRSPHEVGARIGLALALSSVGSLVSTPIQGALLGSHFHWNRPAIFSGAFMLISAIFNMITRTLLAKERGTQRV